MAVDESSKPDIVEVLERAEGCRAVGNDLLGKGDFADACAQYDKGLLALAQCTKTFGDAKANELRVALHLNASLGNLRRGNLRSAVDHATGAIGLDPCNEKGFFRRATACSSLSQHPGHEENAKLALVDFQKVIELNPENKEAVKQLKQLRAQLKKDEKDLADSQRDTYKNMFSGGKQLYDDPPSAKDRRVAPVIHTDREAENGTHRQVLAVEQVAFHYTRGEPVLEGVTLDLHAGRCVGLFGNNAAGKTTLARILTAQLSPTAGTITHCGSTGRVAQWSLLQSLSRSSAVVSIIGAPAVGVGVGAVLLGMGRLAVGDAPVDAATWAVKSVNWMQWAALGLCIAVVAIAVRIFLDSRNTKRAQYSVIHLSSETSDKEDIPAKATIEKMIGEKMGKHLLPDERRNRVIAMLVASGFQMYNQETGEAVGTPEDYIRDGLRYGVLSGGQKHLMYVLRCLASGPDVIVCDEALGGLDAFRQPRVLHMFRRMKEELGTSILYISTELSQLRLLSDSIAYMSDGVISEIGPAEEVLEFPKHPHCKEYVTCYRGLPGCHVIGGKLAESFTALVGDANLAGKWLPK